MVERRQTLDTKKRIPSKLINSKRDKRSVLRSCTRLRLQNNFKSFYGSSIYVELESLCLYLYDRK